MPTKPNEVDPLIQEAQENIKAEYREFKKRKLNEESQQSDREWVDKRARERIEDRNKLVQEGIKLHEDLKAKTDEVIRTAQSGFETFASAMSSILELTTRLAEVLEKNSVIRTVLDGVKEKAMPYVDTVGANIASWIKKKFGGGIEIDLPKLKHNVHFKDDGFAVDDVTTGLPELTNETRDQVNNAFSHGIKLWLEKCDYRETPAGSGKYQNSSGVTLTEAKFNELKENADLGLDRFLSKQFQMDVEEAPNSPSPRT